jgi:signal transduction histidine kinase/CheY-like chemotaxis protein
MSERLQVLHQVGNTLQQAPDFDTLCFWAVELGLQEMDFGRIALKLYDEEHSQSQATFGTDRAGNAIDERGQRLRLIPEEVREQLSQRIPGYVTLDNMPLFDKKKIVGHGQQVLAPLWDGSRIVGYLEIDNCLTDEPIPEEIKQVLALYATTVGHMIGRFHRDEQLRQNEQFLRDIFDSFQSGLTVIDHELNIVRTNRYMRERHHLPETDGKMKCHHVFRGLEHVCEECPTQGVFRTGEPQRSTVQVFDSKTQEERFLDIAAYPMHDAYGQVRWAIEFTNDVTEDIHKNEEHRRFEEQMQMTQKLESLGVLAGGVAHDFNNLLMGILGNADLALGELESSNPAWCNVEQISESAGRASELCRQMLAYAGRGNFMVEQIDLGDLASDMESLLSSLVPKKSEFRITVDEDLPNIEVDETQIRQLLMNLLSNSAEALGEQAGEVEVHFGAVEVEKGEKPSVYTGQALKPGKHVEIRVTDTGCGMDGDTLKNLFDPFFTTKFQGRGLGMAAVLGIIRSYDGDVQVESDPGLGTTVLVRLPASKGSKESEPTSNRKNDYTGPMNIPEGKVLLVDDEMVVREVGEGMLERLGYNTITAIDGLDGVEKFEEHCNDVLFVILDMTMPRMDGEEALRAMRAIRPDVPVLISSGYTEQEILGRFEDEHISGFVAKPYSLKNLEKSARQVLSDLQSSGTA